jgi:phage terminase large subunit-like protein
VAAFIESSCRITKESFAGSVGEPLLLRHWQRAMLDRLFARRSDGRRLHRTGLIGIPRKNGKTAIIAGVALFGLVMRLYRDVIEVPSTASVYRALSADAPLKEGLSPTLTVVDEVHVIDEDLWNVFALAMGARPEPLMVGITTAGARFDSHGRETVCYRLFDYGRRTVSGEISDPAFYFEWWSVSEDLDYRDPGTWRLANPGLGDVLDPDQLVAAVGPTPEHEFRTKHLNQWVATKAAALPTGAWEARANRARQVSLRADRPWLRRLLDR